MASLMAGRRLRWAVVAHFSEPRSSRGRRGGRLAAARQHPFDDGGTHQGLAMPRALAAELKTAGRWAINPGSDLAA